MRTEIGARLRIEDPSPALVRWCRAELELTNPEYVRRSRMGLWTGKTPRTLCLYAWDGPALVLPFGCLREILPYLEGEAVKTFPPGKLLDYAPVEIPLYDYQETAAGALARAKGGVLVAPAGSGKTQIGIALAEALRVKTLWLTHTRDLLKQSRDRAAQYLPPDLLGTISEGRVQIGPFMTFATVQTLSRLDLDLYRDAWDCVIVDECHRVSGTPGAVTQFSKVLNRLRARHKYGLTATAHRADGLMRAAYALLGPVVWTVPPEAVKDRILSVAVRPRRTGAALTQEARNPDGTLNYAKMLSYLTQNRLRNTRILLDLVENAEHSNLILSSRLDHLETLRDRLPKPLQASAALLHGGQTSNAAKAQREQAIEDMRAGKLRYLFATYQLAREGLDIPRLDRLYLTTPQKDYAVITQSIGRVARAFPGKTRPEVWDYVDADRYLERAWKTRCGHYRRAGCPIIEEGGTNV